MRAAGFYPIRRSGGDLIHLAFIVFTAASNVPKTDILARQSPTDKNRLSVHMRQPTTIVSQRFDMRPEYSFGQPVTSTPGHRPPPPNLARFAVYLRRQPAGP
jgi:hypothetical protein